MATVRTLEGEYYELPDGLLKRCRVDGETVARHARRVRPSLRVDVSREFIKRGPGRRASGESK